MSEPDAPGQAPIAETVVPQGRRRARQEGGKPTGKAGRPLVAATVVAIALLAVLGASLLLSKQLFVAVLSVGVVIGTLEVSHAMTAKGIRLPLPPLILMAVGLPAAAYASGAQSLVALFALSIPVLVVWRLAEGGPNAGRDSFVAVMVATWIPLLASFLALLAVPSDGAARVLTAVLVTAASDTGGYAVGVLFGKHPMAPKVSPKKSWEGFAGSVVSSLIVGVVCVTLLLGGEWWVGLLVGAFGVITATVGDLAESLVKRDLAVKDMSNLLPGHGGLLDRVDSLLLTAPVVWVILTAWVPVLS
jgi:phosphatidate cytidylyltransferase